MTRDDIIKLAREAGAGEHQAHDCQCCGEEICGQTWGEVHCQVDAGQELPLLEGGMTREEIIKLAREAGMERVIDVHKDGTRTIELPHPDLLERFAALVAAAERERIIAANAPEIEKINAHIKALEKAVEDEREACAKMCEDMGRGHGFAFAEFDCAAAIRARGNNMNT